MEFILKTKRNYLENSTDRTFVYLVDMSRDSAGWVGEACKNILDRLALKCRTKIEIQSGGGCVLKNRIDRKEGRVGA